MEMQFGHCTGEIVFAICSTIRPHPKTKSKHYVWFFLSLLLQHQRTLHCGAIFHGRRNIVLKPSLLSHPLSPSHPIDLLFSFLRPPLYCLPTLDRESPFLKLCRRPRVSLPLSLTPMTPTTMTVTSTFSMRQHLQEPTKTGHNTKYIMCRTLQRKRWTCASPRMMTPPSQSFTLSRARGRRRGTRNPLRFEFASKVFSKKISSSLHDKELW